MNEIIQLLRQIIGQFQPWVIVSPWEQAVRVRLGKRIKLLDAGIHLKLPFLDSVYLQSVRLRVAGLYRQTLSTRDGVVITVGGTIGYKIEDIGKLYRTLHHGEGTIANLARVEISNYVTSHKRDECEPERIVNAVNGALDFSQYGLSAVSIAVTDFAIVRTLRLIGDTEYGYHGDPLSTTKSTTDPQ